MNILKNKKILIPGILAVILIVVLLAALILRGCGEKTYAKFPEGYKIASVNVGGMTIEEAKAALKKQAADYKVNVKLDDVSFELAGADLGLTYSDAVDLQTVCNKANKEKAKAPEVFLINSNEEIQEAMLVAYEFAKAEMEAQDAEAPVEGQEAATEETITLNDPTKASIKYDEATGAFVGVDGVSGEAPDYEKAVEDLVAAVKSFAAEVETKSEMKQAEGEIAADSEDVKKALENANEYLGLQIDCVFAPEGKEAKTETIAPATIASWLMVQRDGLSVELNAEEMSAYCATLAAGHDVSKTRTAKFKTTGGGEISVSVAASGQTVDANALYTDIFDAISAKKSGAVNATYSEVPESEQSEYVDFGGNYCEVDLTNQMVYVYNNGSCVVSTPVVTGCVAKGYRTPTGVYSIFSMDKDRYLNGPGYKTWVNFFLPFNGGVGFHDAGWRSSFGGNIYLYNGSHGCINMPYSEVKKLYNNVSLGTKVIVYGGATSVEGLAQRWSGTTAYTVTYGAGPFALDMNCLDEAPKTYSSDNNGVATVDANGVVTPVGVGTCTITVNSGVTPKYKASTATVTITVLSPEKASTSISASGFSLTVGQSKNIGASASSGAGLTYSSSNTGVATVDGSGNVTAKGAGSTTITITAGETGSNKGASATITVSVYKNDASVSTGGSFSLTVGESKNIGASSSSKGTLSYAVVQGDGNGVKVDANGNVTAIAAGTYTIKITSAETALYNAASTTITVTVNQASTPGTETQQ